MKINKNLNFDILFEKHITKKIYPPRNVKFSDKFKTLFELEIKQLLFQGISMDRIHKALLFLIDNAASTIKSNKNDK